MTENGAWYNMVDKLERTLEPWGLMTGTYAVPMRMLFGATLGAAVVVFLKPNSMFEDGVPRPWFFLSDPKQGGPRPTHTPWLIGPAIGAVLFGLFV